jgi:CubicO group peptidase (beta-lactamase class C family)
MIDRRAALAALGSAACAAARTAAPPAMPQCPERALRSGLPVTTPEAAGLRAEGVAALVERSRASGSHALVVLHDGAVAVEEYFGRRPHPICAMSASKSVAQLAVAVLVGGAHARLDEPMTRAFPAWRADRRKSKVLLRHLLSHGSGLDVGRADVNAGETIERAAERAPMHHEPGMDFRYNNLAVDCLAPFVRARSGLHLDDLLQREVFGPLGVRGAWWVKDAAGCPRAAGELMIEPVELAKVGQLMLQDGVWEGRRVLPQAWVAQSTAPSQPYHEGCGLLWWLHGPRAWSLREELFASWEEAGVAQDVIARVRPLVGRAFASEDALTRARDARLTPDQRRELRRLLDARRAEPARVALTGAPTAYYAKGWVGQWLVVVPSRRLVAVRMRAVDRHDQRDSRAHEHRGFVDDALAL